MTATTLTPFFESQDRVRALEREAALWVGTPFSAHSCVRGAGVDCVHLVAGIYMAAGVFDAFAPPPYTLDGGSHNDESAVLQWLNHHPNFRCVYLRQPSTASDTMPDVMKCSTGALQPGDALCFLLGRSEHHVGLLLSGGRFVHVIPKRSVLVSSLNESAYRRRLSAVYRAYAA